MRRACFIAASVLVSAIVCLRTGVAADKKKPHAGDGKSADSFDPAKLPAPAKRDVDFMHDIRPLLESHCIKCHGADRHESGLSLHRKETAFNGGDSGKAFEPGKSAASRLIRYVSGLDSETVMPPDGEGERLSAEQVGLLRAWIDQGAKWPAEADVAASAATTHWAYVKPQRPALPTVSNPGWCRNEIDRFVLARFDKEGLRPQPEAGRARLLRRVSLDLIGLPPTVEEVDAFVADASPDAYEKVVDRLLASPRYGERWARPWLDLARYADTHGYEKDPRRSMWPYRDWVITALNANMPFDRFTIEQLAGDLLPSATLEQRIATGFHRNTMINTEGGVDPEEYRIVALIDRVNTTATVWLGTTLGCCQCHSHKYDPFKQQEYYRFMAFFNGTADSGSSDGPQAEIVNADAATLADLARLEAALKTPNADAKTILADLDAVKKKIESQKATTLVMQELPKLREQHVFTGGSFLNPGEVVTPGVPAVLNPLPAGQPLNRLTLAKWLVDPANPLTARVAINRIWAAYFGSGIVLTAEDFGTKGERPTHPELLDWLATEFIRRGWDMKAMHRLIVTSATYRQSSAATPQLIERDPMNRLLARGPRLRLEAEMVRDQALSVAGLLSGRIGGPSVMPPQPDGIWNSPYSGDKWETPTGENRYRRGLYTFWKRTSPYPSFTSFDAPSREYCVVRRPRTNTPLQALTLLNDPVYVEAAQTLARRMVKEAGATDDRSRALRGWRLCVARTPNEPEIARLLLVYQQELDRFRHDSKAAAAMAGNAAGAAMPAGVDSAQLAAWTVVANVLLNLDETLNKG